MTTPRRDDKGDMADLESSLAEAMNGFVGRFQPPEYLPGAFSPKSGRTPPSLTRRGPALLAATAILVLGGVVAAVFGAHGSADSTSPNGGGLSPHPWTGPSADNPGPGIAMTVIFNAVVQYQDPATANQVDLQTVKNFLKDDATFNRLWGQTALGLTCGQHIDSYTIFEGRVDFFARGRHLPINAAVVFTQDETRISDVLCAPNDGATPVGKNGQT